MEQEKFSYTIGGKKFVQRPLVLGQILLLTTLLKGLPEMMSLGPNALITTMGHRMPDALAIALIPEDSKMSDKSNEGKRRFLAEEISFSIDADTVVKVVEDFFDCNPIVSLMEKLSGATEKIAGQIKELKTKQSTPSAQSSPEETSPSATTSSGDIPQPSASHT